MAQEPKPATAELDSRARETPLSSEKLTSAQYTYLRWCEQYYWVNGVLPSKEEAYKHYDAWDAQFQERARNHPKFKNMLQARHIPVPNEYGPEMLTEEQMMVAQVMLDIHDKRSRLKKLTELGISTATYNAWLRQPAYRRFALARAEDLLVGNQAVAHLSLINRVEQGDLGAIKYFNALTGRFREAAQAAVQVNVNQASPQTLLIEVVEIIQRHVKDPAVLDAIANDILALTQGGPQVKPTVRAQVAG